MARSLFAVALLALVLAAGCGAKRESSPSDAARPAPVKASSGTTRTTVYFLTDGGEAPLGVRRTITAKSPNAREALKALFAGPTRAERDEGITTAIPAGTRLLSITFRRHGADATVHLVGLPALHEGDVMATARIVAQIARTLIGVSGIERVWLRDEGEPWGLLTRDGEVRSGPWGYEQLTGFDIGSACPGTETVVCNRFAALP